MADDNTTLAGLNAAIAAFAASGAISEYTLPSGQHVKRESLQSLMDARDRLQAQVNATSRPLFRPVILGRGG